MTIRAHIESLGFRGEGVARLSGKVVFVPGALPGEDIELENYSAGKKHDRATLARVLCPSPHRRETPCRHDHSGGCGGCSLLDADPQAVARWKTQILGSRLEKAGLSASLLHTPRVAGDGLHYRNHATFLVARRGQLAFVTRKDRTPDSKPRTLIKGCPVLHPLLDELRGALDGKCSGLDAVELRAAARTGERLVVLHGTHLPTRLDPVAFEDITFVGLDDEGYLPLKGLPWIHEIVSGQKLRISPPSVFPINTQGAEEIVKAARQFGQPDQMERIWNPNAGIGLFALCAARGATRIYAIENDPYEIKDLKVNAEEEPLVQVRNQHDHDAMKDLRVVSEDPDLIMAQSPSGGFAAETVAEIQKSGAPRMVLHHWESNDLLRDLDGLKEFYRPDAILPIDLASGTTRLDTVTHLSRRTTAPAK